MESAFLKWYERTHGNGKNYEPAPETAENLHLMCLIDKWYMQHPELGSPRMMDWLRDKGYEVNRKRVARLMQLSIFTK